MLCVAFFANSAHAQNMTARLTPAQTLYLALDKYGPEVFTDHAYNALPIRHVVAFRYRITATASERQSVRERFLALQNQVQRPGGKKYNISIEVGTQNSGEQNDLAIDDVFLVTFCSEGDRNFYVGRPIVTDPQFYDSAHDAFKSFAAPYLASVIVLDYKIALASAEAIPSICKSTKG
ncbi:stress responsive alpha-beta barrel [Pandoraea horticolens]|uniref:Stress responsive alpha-beta barrel n=2 Tax=Pandoraea horticolens TaxID=2508298 RepID=A0A5E4YWH1_9BURK|nr:stress responsive alpha-beta barrel [Pandoraea horticolens]